MIVTVDMGPVADEQGLHSAFAQRFGFPDFYGSNLDAWVDCMSYLDRPEAGMTSLHVPPGSTLTLVLDNVGVFKARCPRLFERLIESTAFVNWRRAGRGEPALLALAYYA